MKFFRRSRFSSSLVACLSALSISVFSFFTAARAQNTLPDFNGANETMPLEAPSPETLRLEAAALQALRARLEASEKLAAKGGGVTDAQNLALWRFKLEQARLWLDDLDRGLTFNPKEAQRRLRLILDRADTIARARGDAVFPASSPIHERAYLAQNDGSSQPYWVFLPRGYSSSRKYPLVLFLHGYDPGLTKAQPWIPGDKTWNLATARGFIFAVPYGRRNTDFLGVGEDDTLAVLDEVKRHYSVDESRTYLAGASMGGYGTLAIGLHHPDLWAGISTMAARSDIYLWLKLNREQLAQETPWKLALYEADDPRSLKQNAAHLPVFLQHGALDQTVDVTHSRLFTSDLRDLNYAVRYREVADGDHFIYWQSLSYETALDWLAALRPIGTTRPTPRRVLYTTYDLRDNGAYWARIEAFQIYGNAAHIDAQIKRDNTIEVTTENTARFSLTPPAALFTRGVPITLRVNGQAVATNLDPQNPIRWNDATVQDTTNATATNATATNATATNATATRADTPDMSTHVAAVSPGAPLNPRVVATVSATPIVGYPGIKTPRRSGPLRNCYRDPFLLVYGTRGVTADNENGVAVGRDEANARRFAHEWNLFADGIPPVKSDREVSVDDRRRYNLILFGTRDSNSVLAEFADRLPVELTANGYRLNDKKIEGKNLGLVMCYPSPFDARRMVVVQSGGYWGDALALNHKFDLQPDYIVFDEQFDISDGTNQAVAAGYFDNNWRLTSTSPLPAPSNEDAPAIDPAFDGQN